MRLSLLLCRYDTAHENIILGFHIDYGRLTFKNILDHYKSSIMVIFEGLFFPHQSTLPLEMSSCSFLNEVFDPGH